jgi:hypothetical protein
MTDHQPISRPIAYPATRLPRLALMTRRLSLAPDGASLAAAARFVRDTCQSWGVADTLLDASERVVTALRRLAAATGATTFELIIEARSYTVTVRVRDRAHDDRPASGVPLRGADRFGDPLAIPTLTTWMLVSAASGDEVWAVAPREVHPPASPRLEVG